MAGYLALNQIIGVRIPTPELSMVQQSFEFLRSTPEDAEFHIQRIMFWVVDGELITGLSGTSMSHLEMAETMGWLQEGNTEEFFKSNPRGFYLKESDRVHFYRGLGFMFDDSLKEEILKKLPDIALKLNFTEKTKVYFGPKDRLVKGVEYPIEFAGTIGKIIK